MRRAVLILVSLLMFPFGAAAEVEKVTITSRTVVADGHAFGATGASMGSLVAYGGQSLLALVEYRKFTGLPIGGMFRFGRRDLNDAKRNIAALLRSNGPS